ncbi:STAS domain-containing protein [Microbispora siamensis]|uniref:Anti-sigma factor antagonist n=1 Tax=Microbispora siamensis TaxID=564413 RepID=A0ABQ4GWF8_9ACTN|nr:STAS domain-containing protein [Microbispora siamensis]GIH65751.1 hypothetical protein Msi02_65680 [Microbispora siamensis]
MGADNHGGSYHQQDLDTDRAVREDVTLLSLQGVLDFTTHALLHRRIEDLFREQPPPALILDLTELDFCDSSSLAILIAIRRHFPDPDRCLALVGVNGRMARLLELTRVITLFRCYPTREDAMKALGLASTSRW